MTQIIPSSGGVGPRDGDQCFQCFVKDYKGPGEPSQVSWGGGGVGVEI